MEDYILISQLNDFIFCPYSIYLDNILIQIREKYGKLFTPDDSVVIFEVSNSSVIKFGNAIHRDQDLFFL